MMGRSVFFYIKINGAIYFIGEPQINKFFYNVNLFDDMAGGRRLDAGGEDVELSHDRVKIVGVALDDFHGFKLFEAGLLADFILSFIFIVFQVADVGDVADVTDPNQIIKMLIGTLKKNTGTKNRKMRASMDWWNAGKSEVPISFQAG